MNLSVRMSVCAFVFVFACSACTYQRKVYLKRIDLPEYIYKTPLENDYMASSVGIFNFREPPYALGTGNVAAELLFDEVLSRRIFAMVEYESEVSDMRMETLMGIAREKGYDLIITGDIVYYFEGSDEHAARIDERLRVIDVKNNKVLWYAKAVDMGPNAPLVDYAVVVGYGAPAPSNRTLFKRNAEKFARMLLALPSQKLWTEDDSEVETGAEWDTKLDEPLAGGRQFLDVPFEGQTFSVPEVTKSDSDENASAETASRKPAAASNQPIEKVSHKSPEVRQTGNLLPENPEHDRLLEERIYFNLDESTLAHPEVSMEIQGYCDERGTYAYNMALGAQRAWSAKRSLMKLGILKERLGTVSYGKERPIETAHNKKSWAKNRRAEFVTMKESK